MAKARVLPSWMQNKGSSTSHQELALLTYAGRKTYCYNEGHANIICSDLMKSLNSTKCCGFDMEWTAFQGKSRTQGKTAVIQLCPSEEECIVFHVSQFRRIPEQLQSILEDQSIIKVGVAIRGDVDKLLRDYDVNTKSVIDLSDFANPILNTSASWSLQSLCRRVLHCDLDKERTIRCSNWDEFPLSDTHIKYAALDAYASLAVYLALKGMKDKQAKH